MSQRLDSSKQNPLKPPERAAAGALNMEKTVRNAGLMCMVPVTLAQVGVSGAGLNRTRRIPGQP